MPIRRAVPTCPRCAACATLHSSALRASHYYDPVLCPRSGALNLVLRTRKAMVSNNPVKGLNGTLNTRNH
uniref:Transposase n=1 Tax=Ascaris lumbricoides TaxID=6252 RepID=A0A0M3HWR4_ASCLU